MVDQNFFQEKLIQSPLYSKDNYVTSFYTASRWFRHYDINTDIDLTQYNRAGFIKIYYTSCY